MPSFQNYLKGIKSEIQETDAAELQSALASGSPLSLIDVREQDEYVQGYIQGARWIPRGYLELRIEDAVPDRSQPVVLYCNSGTRSALAARSLSELGYEKVKSLAGGFTGWKRAGQPFELPVTLSAEQQARYSRHTMLPEVGEAGQLKLLRSKV